MGSSALPRLLFAGVCLGLCLAAAGCRSSSARTADGVAPTAVPSSSGSPTATSALGASLAAPTGTDAPSAPPSVPHYKNLPTGWKTFSSWDAKMVAMAGPNAKANVVHDGAEDPGAMSVGSEWAAPGFGELSFSVGEDKNHTPTSIFCGADGYNAGNAEADSAIEKLFRQCVSADFPGADTAGPEQWIQGALASFFEKERQAPNAGGDTSAKEFGDGHYGIGAGYTPAYGLSIELIILGPFVR